ncbi:hypothetical protein ACFQ1L_30020 [Phytohabitans flavus]|uniref:hypothetical protein n=1 Tax=Phytohabitans flavus TaxID=1076124 RepID=UPI00363889FE
MDWPGALDAGHHAVGGADSLLRSSPPAEPLSCHRQLTGYADAVAGGYERLAAALRDPKPRCEPPPADPGGWPTDLGLDMYRLSDLRVWLDRLAEDLAQVGDQRR